MQRDIDIRDSEMIVVIDDDDYTKPARIVIDGVGCWLTRDQIRKVRRSLKKALLETEVYA